MEILPQPLQEYLEAHCDPEPELLQRINRETHLKILKPNMLSGHYQGRLLSFLSKMMQPKLILEIGTYTGYATLCLAEGLAEDGILHTIEANEELEEMLKTNFEGCAFREKINVYFGQAMQIIPNLPLDNVDLVFIDADKKNNFAYFCIILDKVRAGGLIIIDNVLWKGKVYGPENDTDTKIIRELNDQIAADERIEKLILPVRDGLMVIKKK
jgi:caffeoyl-CoA O-methyltransferase